MVEEAGIAVGVGQVVQVRDGMTFARGSTIASSLEAPLRVIQSAVSVAAHSWLLVYTMRRTFQDRGMLGMLAALAFPLAIKLYKGGWDQIRKLFGYHRARRVPRRVGDNDFMRADMIYRIAQTDKQEVVLFGLGDWITARWEAATRASMENRQQALDQESFRPTPDQAELLLNILFQVSARTRAKLTSKVVMSTGWAESFVSFSQLSVHSEGATRLFNVLFNLGDVVDSARTNSYWLGALAAAYECQSRDEATGVDYDELREAGGMRIETRDLQVRYSGQTKPAVHGINLSIKAGETLALVGFNGAGKSTLVKALMGLSSHTTGSVEINGTPLEEYRASTLHARISCVFQDYKKYYFSLRDNIGIGDVTRIEDEDALKAAMADGGADTILEKASLDTLLNPYANLHARPGNGRQQGMALSGGQWLRVAVSRAFMRAATADLVVFDEPSSALDPAAEAALFDTIYDLAHREGGTRATTVFISHGFGNVRRADHIAFMDKGVS